MDSSRSGQCTAHDSRAMGIGRDEKAANRAREAGAQAKGHGKGSAFMSPPGLSLDSEALPHDMTLRPAWSKGQGTEVRKRGLFDHLFGDLAHRDTEDEEEDDNSHESDAFYLFD